jgi:hypothetical protein
MYYWVHEWIKRSASCMKYSAKKSHHQVYKCKCVTILEGTYEVKTQRITSARKSLKRAGVRVAGTDRALPQ